MPNPEIMRIADAIAREKNIEREQVYVDIEQAIASGLRKHFKLVNIHSLYNLRRRQNIPSFSIV